MNLEDLRRRMVDHDVENGTAIVKLTAREVSDLLAMIKPPSVEDLARTIQTLADGALIGDPGIEAETEPHAAQHFLAGIAALRSAECCMRLAELHLTRNRRHVP